MSTTNVVKVPDEFKCPLTNNIFIEPVKSIIFCTHVFEKLALANRLRNNSNCCPLCRKEILHIEPDTDLAKKIQDEFVKINPENAKRFNSIKNELHTTHKSLISHPVMPQTPFSQITFFFQKYNRQPTSKHFDNSFKKRENFRREICDQYDDKLKIENANLLIANDDLIEAEKIALQISEINERDEILNKIARTYLLKYNNSNIEQIDKIADEIISFSIKNPLDEAIILAHIENKKYSLAINKNNISLTFGKIHLWFLIGINSFFSLIKLLLIFFKYFNALKA